MTEPINLTELRALAAERQPEQDPWSGAIAQLPVEVEADELLALIDTAEAAIRKYAEMRDSSRYWPNDHRLRATLARYTTDQPQ